MRALQLLVACSYFITFCYGNGISIVGPGYLHPNRIFTVVIANSYPNKDVMLRVSLTGGDNIVIANKQSITELVKRNTVKPFKFKVGKIPNGEYFLHVRNAGGSVSFRKTIELQYISQTMSIFVQIDKPVYKPGDLLRFRIVIIDIDAMPVADLKSLEIDIKDEGENTIKQWTKPKLHNGVFESAMVIPGSPALGNWTIKVSADDGFIKQDKTKHFLVMEYVLPTFIVDVFPSELLLIENKKIALTIKSFYTFGDPVKGHVELKLFLSEESLNPDHSISKSITGTSQVEFNLEEQIDITSDDNKFEMVMVNVTVTEDFSNRVVSRSFHIPVYRYPFVVTSVAFDMGNSQIKRFEISVKDHYQQAVCCHQVKLEVKPQRTGRTRAITRESSLDTLGEAFFTFETSESLYDLDFKVNIGPTKDVALEPVIHDVDAADVENDSHPSSEVITIEPKSISTPLINKEHSFVVRSADRMRHVWYVVINQDNIVTQAFSSINTHKHTIKIKLTPAMAPRSSIIVFTTKNVTLHYSIYEIKFNTFRNSFKFSIDANEYLPNQDIALVTDAAKDSYVAYHAIDVSALHVGHERPFNGFGFTKQDVLDELDKYLQRNEAISLIGSFGYFLESSYEIGNGNSRLQRFGHHRPAKKAILLRTDFPEVFLWQNFSMQGKQRLRTIETAPDSITSWQLTGFALSPTAGLGIMDGKAEFVVKKPFYIIANLPYSIKRNEISRIQVTIFSFLQTQATTDVWLYNKNDEIEFIDQSSNDPTRRKKSIMVPANYGEQTSFLIRAKKLGNIAIKIEAKNVLVSDGIEKTLLVTPESRRYEFNEPRFIEHDNYTTKHHSIRLNIPQRPDEGSVNITISVNGEVLGPAIENLHSLFQKPTGCGEQSMLKFVPNVVVLDYLEESGNNDPEIKTKAINFLEEGYANQLKYKKKDGSFSVFEHNKGGTFLTAFVAKSFKMADKYIKVNKTIVEEAFDWLANIQDSDGLFPEVGDVYNTNMQGGLYNKKKSLSAFVAIAFLETADIAKKHRSVIDKTINYLASNLDGMDRYELALATYALTLSNHPKNSTAMEKLINASEMDDSTKTRHWENEALSVETSSYGLLSYLKHGRELDAISVARWLISQQKSRGEFSGMQATFVGLKALAKVSATITPDRNEYTVTVRQKIPAQNRKTTFGITRHSGSILPEQLPSDGRVFDVEIHGRGYGVFQISYSYHQNINLQETKKRFDVTVELLPESTRYKQSMKVCTKFVPPELYNKSNMALVEVFFPSGHEVDEGSLVDLWRSDYAGKIQKIERRFAGTSLVVYYNTIDTRYKCFTVSASRVHLIARQLPSYVVVYDYDNDDHFGIATYSGRVLQPCDICDPIDCRTMNCPT